MWLLGEHLPFGLLADLAEGRAHPTAADGEHLAACERCASDLAWLQRVIAASRGPADDEPPAQVVARIKALFRARRRKAAPGPRLLYAVLRFDSAHSAPVFGLRAAADLGRQLLLRAGAYEVDLRISPADERWSIAGQLLPDVGAATAASGSVELLGAAGSVRAELSAQGEFALPPVRAGRYNMTITLPDSVIAIPGLEPGG